MELAGQPCKAVIGIQPFLRRHAASHADDGFCFHDSFRPMSDSMLSDMHDNAKPGWSIEILWSRHGADSYLPI